MTESLDAPDQAKLFLKMSQSDLKAAKLLYKHNQYPQAVFFLQQSVEKGYKAYHLLNEHGQETNPNDEIWKKISLKKIGHTPTKITEKMALDVKRRLENVKKMIELLPNNHKIFEKIHVDYPQLIEQIELSRTEYALISKHPENYQTLRRNQIDEKISNLNHLIKEYRKSERNIKQIKITDEIKADIIKKLSDQFQPIVKSNPEAEKNFFKQIDDLSSIDHSQLEEIMKQLWKIYLDSGCINAIYAELAAISQPHESLSRYPTITIDPLLFYSPRLPLLSRFNTLIRYMKIANDKFEKLLALDKQGSMS